MFKDSGHGLTLLSDDVPRGHCRDFYVFSDGGQSVCDTAMSTKDLAPRCQDNSNHYGRLVGSTANPEIISHCRKRIEKKHTAHKYTAI